SASYGDNPAATRFASSSCTANPAITNGFAWSVPSRILAPALCGTRTARMRCGSATRDAPTKSADIHFSFASVGPQAERIKGETYFMYGPARLFVRSSPVTHFWYTTSVGQ